MFNMEHVVGFKGFHEMALSFGVHVFNLIVFSIIPVKYIFVYKQDFRKRGFMEGGGGSALEFLGFCPMNFFSMGFALLSQGAYYIK